MIRKNILFFVLFLSVVSFGQLKKDPFQKPDYTAGIVQNSNLLFGLIDPSKFSMRHAFDVSYMSMGEHGISTTSYTNSMRYDFSENLNLRVDASLLFTPYSSFGSNFNDQMSGIYISRAELNFRPWENTIVTIQYRNLPGNGYYNNYGPYGRGGFYGNSLFDRGGFFDNYDPFYGR